MNTQVYLVVTFQVYDAQRNEQFKTLQKRLTDAEARLVAPSFSEQQQQDIDRLLMQSKQKVEEAEQEKMKVLLFVLFFEVISRNIQEDPQHRPVTSVFMTEVLIVFQIEDENRALRVRNKQLEDAVAAQLQQIQHLSTTSTSPTAGSQQEDKDHIRMLEAQVQIFTEDFEQERKDRERAQAKCAELQQEMELVKRQVSQLFCA